MNNNNKLNVIFAKALPKHWDSKVMEKIYDNIALLSLICFFHSYASQYNYAVIKIDNVKTLNVNIYSFLKLINKQTTDGLKQKMTYVYIFKNSDKQKYSSLVCIHTANDDMIWIRENHNLAIQQNLYDTLLDIKKNMKQIPRVRFLKYIKHFNFQQLYDLFRMYLAKKNYSALPDNQSYSSSSEQHNKLPEMYQQSQKNMFLAWFSKSTKEYRLPEIFSIYILLITKARNPQQVIENIPIKLDHYALRVCSDEKILRNIMSILKQHLENVYHYKHIMHNYLKVCQRDNESPLNLNMIKNIIQSCSDEFQE